MSCDRSAQVHAYHDHALTAPARVALEAHLDACADCRALLADLRGLSSLIGGVPLAPLSTDAMARISSGWRTARDRGVLRISSWLTAAAAAILVGAILFIPDRKAAPTTPMIATATAEPAAWETVAVMPPLEADENVPELIVLAQWMANDLSLGGGSTGERQ